MLPLWTCFRPDLILSHVSGLTDIAVVGASLVIPAVISQCDLGGSGISVVRCYGKDGQVGPRVTNVSDSVWAPRTRSARASHSP
jgi:hypothetical protein